MSALLGLAAQIISYLIPYIFRNAAQQEKAAKILKEFIDGKRTRANMTLEIKANHDAQSADLDEKVRQMKNPKAIPVIKDSALSELRESADNPPAGGITPP